MRRLRVTFSKGEEVRYISHLDLMRTWERILRRAGLRLAHSQGFNPRPKLVFAAPLSVGVTSAGEIVDVDLEGELRPAEFRDRVQTALPPGIALVDVMNIPLDAPPPMARVLSSDYTVELQARSDLGQCLADFLARSQVSYERVRKGTVKQADMRPAVLDLWLESTAPPPKIGMRLRLDLEGQGVRPEEVVRALDPEAHVLRVHRTGLQLRETPAALTLAPPSTNDDRAGVNESPTTSCATPAAGVGKSNAA